MSEQAPCNRCGSFVSPETAAQGIRTCEPCIGRAFEKRALGWTSAGSCIAMALGSALGVGVPLLLARVLDEDAFVGFAVFGLFGGAMVGGLVAHHLDGKRRERAHEEAGLDKVAWPAALADESRSPTRTVAGYAFIGDRCVLFVTREGIRRLVRSDQIARQDIDVKQVRLHLNRHECLVLIGDRAREAVALLR